jgi:hypothetical protein
MVLAGLLAVGIGCGKKGPPIRPVPPTPPGAEAPAPTPAPPAGGEAPEGSATP